MRVELLDYLRCPGPDHDALLVASAVRTIDRDIIEGTLGCPTCGREFPVRDGAAWFGEDDASREAAAPSIAPPADASDNAAGADTTDAVMRLAAMLAFQEGGGFYVLAGSWSALARGLAELAPSLVLLVAPTGGASDWSALRGTGDALPLAEGTARGIAIDRPSVPLARAAARALRSRGRLVAPAATPVPDGIIILARDSTHWVGERIAEPRAGELVTPRRAGPRTVSR